MNNPHFFHAVTNADDGLYECLDCRVLYEPPPTDTPEVQAMPNMPTLDLLEDDVVRAHIQELAAVHEFTDPTLAQLGVDIDDDDARADELHGWLLDAVAAAAVPMATARLLAIVGDGDDILGLLSSAADVFERVGEAYKGFGIDADLQQFTDVVARYAATATLDISTALGLE